MLPAIVEKFSVKSNELGWLQLEYFSIILTDTKETFHEIVIGFKNLPYSEGIIKEIYRSFKKIFS